MNEKKRIIHRWGVSGNEKCVRMLRVIEYVGTPAFINDCINQRGLKGTKIIPGKGFMREAIVGETLEILTKSEVEELGVCRPKIT